MVRPVRVSMLATIIESVRVPSRSGPASLPTSSTFSRGLAIASAVDVPPPAPENSVSRRLRCALARFAAYPNGVATSRHRAAVTTTPTACWPVARERGRAIR